MLLHIRRFAHLTLLAATFSSPAAASAQQQQQPAPPGVIKSFSSPRPPVPATEKAKPLAWSDLKKVVDGYFAEQKGRQPTDLLVASEARASLDRLEKAGWKPKHSQDLLAKVTGDGDFLARELRSQAGRKFLAATRSETLVYDRLDRLTRYSGGDRLVSSILRLPNGPSFMRPKPTPGFGTLMDLLPKGANGQTPVDRNFNKPTGKIYTAEQWVKELEKAFEEEMKAAPAPSAPHR